MYMNRQNIQDIISLTPLQEGMLYHYLSEPESEQYFEQFSLVISGKISVGAMKRAWQFVVDANEMLRTVFRWDKLEKPVQIILKEYSIPVVEYDFSRESALDREKLIRELKEGDRKRKIDIGSEPLRVMLCKLEENKYEMVISNHHIIYDGWSSGIILKELFEAYNCIYDGKEPGKAEKNKFKEFVKWHLKQDKGRQENYWREYLKNFEKQTTAIIDNKNQAYGNKPETYRYTLSKESASKIYEFTREKQTTLAALFYSVWGVLLQRYNNTDDVMFGTTVSGRSAKISGIEEMVGLFINTIPLRINSKQSFNAIELINNVGRDLADREEFEGTSLVDINSYSELSGNDSLFDSIVVIENYPLEKRLRDADNKLKVEAYEMFEMTNFNMTLGVKLFDSIELDFCYKEGAFEAETVKRLCEHFVNILEGVIENADVRVSELNMLGEDERQQLLYGFNNTVSEYEGNKTIFELFEEQAERIQERTAAKIDINLKDVYEELEKNTLNSTMLSKIAKCCFKQNMYLYKFKDISLIDCYFEAVEDEKKDMVLLRTNNQNFVSVNSMVVSLLNCFTGKKSLKEIFDSMSTDTMQFKVWDVRFEGSSISLDKNTIEVCDDFEAFAKLAKILYKSNLIEFAGYGFNQSGRYTVVDEIGLSDSYENKEWMLESAAAVDLGCTTQSTYGDKNVLLYGDTTGTATTGLLYLASFLRRNGIKAYCQLNDLNYSLEALKKNIEEHINTYQPAIVGVSMKWFPHISRALEICKLVKEYSPSTKVVVGGNTASYYCEELLRYEFIDYIISGDGELPLLRICQGADDIPNCIYRKGAEIIRNTITYAQDGSSSKEIYFSHFDEIFMSKADPYCAYIYINTGKGCSMNCFYCAGCREVQKKSFNREKPFMRGVEEVRRDILEAKAYTSTFLFDFDFPNQETTDYYVQIWQGIDLARHFCTYYSWTVPSAEFLKLVSETFKFVNLNIDVCSLSERHRQKLASLKVVKPQPTDSEIISFFEECEKYSNIGVSINLIAGLPYFTAEDAVESERMVSHIKGSYACFKGLDWGRLHVQPGAPIAEDCGAYDMYSAAKTFEDFLSFSQSNLKKRNYPDLSSLDYPFIYYNDENINSIISRHYARVSEIVGRKSTALSISEEITYGELDKKSNQLARLLRTKGVKPNSIVGIMAERSVEMLVGIMGILKSGGAYLPIDPEYPADRVRYMLEDSGAFMLLSQKPLMDRISFDGEVLDLEAEHIYRGESHRLEKVNRPEDLAYVIYTSGTTGRPKGVMIEHRNISNAIQWRRKKYRLDTSDSVLQLFSFAFDGFLTSFFTPIASGSKVVLVRDEEAKDPVSIKNKILTEEITHFIAVPGLYSAVLEVSEAEELKSLKRVTLAGDKVTEGLLARSREKNDRLEIINEYGPTESSVVATASENIAAGGRITIGKPIDNVQVYILDKYNNPQPAGIYGELCISGGGLARGYLNRPELTTEKFITSPFAAGKLYKTGDIARWLPDGNIEFIGRSDYQVKVRGFRIELGEIENRLLSHEYIKEAVVVAKEDSEGSKQLYAYIAGEKELKINELREYLREVLSDYMIPSYFIQLEKLPLTPNGKIDRARLPEPDGNIETGREYEAPRDEVEEKLAAIWQEILKVERVGINDSFFELGGHSLKATGMAAKIHKELNIEIPLKEVFKTSTIKGLSEYIKGQSSSIYETIQPVEEQEYYPVSPAQKRIYTLQQLDPDSTNYNIPGVFVVEGDLEQDKLENAFKALVIRHESFRTSFELVDKEIVQRIHENVELEIEYYEEMERTAQERIKGFIRPFALDNAPLVRIGLIRLMDGKAEPLKRYLLLLDLHHIIADGTSGGIMVNEFAKLYKGEKLPELKLQYKDFAVWQNSILNKGDMRQQEEYWLQEYRRGASAGEIPVLDLPLDLPRPSLQHFEGDSVKFSLNNELTSKLKKIARETGATMYMVLLAGFNILLSKYSRQEDIIVGSPIAGRHHADLENIIGMFVNTLAIRNYPEGKKTFGEFLNEVKERALKAYKNQDYQFEELVEKLKIKRDLSRNALFDVMFAMQNMDVGEFRLEGIHIKPYEMNSLISKFDLTLFAAESDETVDMVMEYCTAIFKRGTIERFGRHLVNILEEVCRQPDIKLEDIDMASREERQQILYAFNDTCSEYPQHKTLHELFEEKAEMEPSRIAILYEDKQLTYGELNEKANQLARVLRQKGVRPDSIVGIRVERSMEMMIGILGILKAGGAYLPIDPEYPEDRTEYMLKDSGACILLTQKRLSGAASFAGEVIELDDEKMYCGAADNPEIVNKSRDLAYVIYTSGSTGRPKGVMIEHKSAVNILTALEKEYPMLQGDTYLLKTSYTFDVSVTELFGWFFGQGKLAILKEGQHRNYIDIMNAVNKYRVTHINFVPSMLSVFVDGLEKEGADKLCSLKYVFAAGEALQPNIIRKFKSITRNIQLENIYGPTECTIYATKFSTEGCDASLNIPIGKPILNTKAYIVDKNNKLQPVGAAGELCIAGDGLARGYLNRPELTAEKFAANPFVPETKLYKTGDLARWLSDGNIEYLGRIDHQVKIRGYRIEPGEIESRLLEHEDIKEAVVTAREDHNHTKYLCAYIIAKRELILSELREHLSKELPDYMIPAYFIKLDSMPLTTSGKIDVKSLPEPDGNIISGTEYEAPRNLTEEKLAEIWQDILKINRIGINDSFFELGGHSLKAMIMAERLHRELGIEIPLREVFKTPTVKGLSEYIEKHGTPAYKSIEPIIEKEYYEVSSAQKRIYTVQQLDISSTSYNLPAMFEIRGEPDIERFRKVFAELVNRHEAFRTSFELFGGQIVQKIHPVVELEVEYIQAVEGTDIEETARNFVRSFDLGKAPLLRVKLIRMTDEGRHLLLIDMHHIISDGTSIGILTREFGELYKCKNLPELKLQYKDYAAWQNELLKAPVIKKQEEYWLDRFSGEIPVLDMSADYPRPQVQSFRGDDIGFKIDEKLTGKLNAIAKEAGATMYMVLLAGFNILLWKYSGQEDIVVGTPIAGRHHADLENVIGMFVNTLAMRNRPEGQKLFREFLTEIRENALKAYENQDYQFEELVEKLNVNRDLSRNLLFDVMFAMQNMDAGEIELEGISVIPCKIQNLISKFDITLTAEEIAGCLEFRMQYCTDLYRRETIERLAGHFINILSRISENSELSLSEVDMLGEEERHTLLYDFNDTCMEYSKDMTINKLFEEQAAKSPDNVAVVFEDRKLTYRELNEKANQLARTLREKGAAADSIVGIMVERSLEMIVGIMGILKAGGAYLPIDPEYPEDRIRYMLKDSGVKLLLVQKQTRDNAVYEIETIELEDEQLYKGDSSNLEAVNKADDIAYIIYTSGSTGKPKGTLITHYNVNRVIINNGYIEITDKDTILQLSNFAFDGSVFDIFGALLKGARLAMIRKECVTDMSMLQAAITEEKVTVFFVTTALFNAIADTGIEYLKDIRKILFGGERVSVQHVKKALAYLGKGKLIHVYGPTESTVYATFYNIDELDDSLSTVPIGAPISNTQIYIVNNKGELCPIGVPGELCIGGDGLARGYLNRPELTEEKFVENPFKPGTRMYRTGDLGRWLVDGNIEFIGRIDHQVKLRGFRIELGEIESQILKHDAVREAVVIERNDKGDRYLCAYIAGDRLPELKELREYLSKELPDYMIPSYFVQLEKLPLTPNGKVDWRALPEPDTSMRTGAEYEAPRNEVEEKLAAIWQEVLGIDRIGINDSFFDLGGHSLKGVQVVNLVYKKLNTKISLRDIFISPTIKGMSEIISGKGTECYSEIVRLPEQEYYELSYPQQRLWIINELEPDSAAYNMPGYVTLYEEVDREAIYSAFDRLLERHDGLRTRFKLVEGRAVQVIDKKSGLDIEFIELSGAEEEKAGKRLQIFEEEAARLFDLEKGPLFRVKLVKAGESEYDLIISLHHIISDGWSMELLKREFYQLYEAYKAGRACCLEPLAVQYRDFAAWQNRLINSGDGMLEAKEYWQKQLGGELPVLDMPVSYGSKRLLSRESAAYRLVVEAETMEKLKSLAKNSGASLFTVLTAGFCLFLSGITGQEDIMLGAASSGRNHESLQGIVGYFINTTILRNRVNMEESFREYLMNVNENTLKALEYQNYPLELILDELKIAYPKIPVFLNMLNMRESSSTNIEDKQNYHIDHVQEVKFDIACYMTEYADGIEINCHYLKGLYKPSRIENLMGEYAALLDNMAAEPDKKLYEYI